MIHCDRCHQDKEGGIEAEMSWGAYFVAAGSGWEKFANPGETVVCDACMWADPRYIATYGRVR